MATTIIQLMKYNRISSPFGERIHPVTGKREFHNGVDIAVPEGTPIAAHTDMVCINTWEDDVGGLQTKVVDDKYIYGLAHLSRCNVRKGDIIRKGEVFAVTGNTGRSTGAHLHLTLRDKFTIKLLDPLKHLPILIFMALMLVGCSADWHIKRASIKESPQYVLNRLYTQYPEFIKNEKQLIYDTIITHIKAIDTMRVLSQKDSIFINHNRQLIKIYRHYDTIRVFADGRTDTLVRVKEVVKYVTQPIERQRQSVWDSIVIIIIIIAAIIVTTNVIRWLR